MSGPKAFNNLIYLHVGLWVTSGELSIFVGISCTDKMLMDKLHLSIDPFIHLYI